MTNIGSMLKALRGDESQKDFADSLNVSVQTVVNYEKGHRLPDIDFLVTVAKKQHYNLLELIDARVKDSPVPDDEMSVAAPMLLEQAIHDLQMADAMQKNWNARHSDENYSTEPATPLVSGSGDQPRLVANDHPYISMDDFVLVNLYDVRASGGYGAWNERERIVSRLAFTREWVRNELNARADRLALLSVDGDSMNPTLRHGDIIMINQDENSFHTDGIYVFMLDDHLMVKKLQRIPDRKVRVISDNPEFPSFEVGDDFSDADQYIVGRVVWSGRRM